LYHAAADQLLVLHQRQVGLDAGGVTVHHEADSAGWRENGDLRVAVAVILTVVERLVPAVAGSFDELRKLRDGGGYGPAALVTDIVDRSAMHADHVEERLAIHIEARTCAAFDAGTVRARSCRSEGRAELSDARRLQISFAAHDGGKAGSEVASGIGVV